MACFCLTILAGCPATAPIPDPEPPPPLARVPAEYWAEADGTVNVSGVTVPGRLRMHYAVYWDGSVVVHSQVAWMDDLDLALGFLWWEVDTEPLRCTQIRTEKTLAATLDGSSLEIAEGAELVGASYFERDSAGRCVGSARRLDVKTPAVLTATHDPDNDHFAMSGSFETVASGGDDEEDDGPFSLIPFIEVPQVEDVVTVSFAMEGHYLNRPPVARLVAVGENVDLAEDGCPATRPDVDPPMVLANTDEGLSVMLHSQSYDLDGAWPQEFGKPKVPRADLEFEQWSRSKAGGFSFLGAGQEIGPVLFKNNLEHQLVLRVTDRWGAEGRQVCRFRVEPLN